MLTVWWFGLLQGYNDKFYRFGDGYILIGFSDGHLISISTHMKEIGQELFQSKNHREKLTDIAISTAVGRIASCGDNR